MGSELRVTIPKVDRLVDGIKRIPGARWLKLERQWKLPMTSFAEVRAFAQENGLTLSDELEVFDFPKRPERPGLVVKGNFLYVSVPHDKVKWSIAKRDIPGIMFDTDNGSWSAPKTSLPEAVRWCDMFDVRVPDALRAVVKIQTELIDRLSFLSNATSGVKVTVPGLEGELMDHQHVAVYYANKVHGRCFIADDMGVGKTLSAIAALEYMNSDERPSYPALVICPPKLTENWAKEYERWLPGRTVQIISTKAQEIGEADVTIIGYSIISARVKELMSRYRSLVCDESHAFKTPGTARTKAAQQIAMGKADGRKGHAGERHGGIPKDGNVMCLTGTPITIRPREFVPQLMIIGILDDIAVRDMGFYKTYCGAFMNGKELVNTGATNLPELNRKLRGIGYVRRERTQVIHDLPPYFPRDILVELTPEARKEYDKAEADIVEYLVDRARKIALELGQDVRSAVVVQRMKAEAAKHILKIGVLRQWSAIGKIPAAKEWADSVVEQDRSIIIGAHHRVVVDALAEQFGGYKIQGGMTTKQVEHVKDLFQRREIRVLPISIEAGKEGHTLTAATEVLPIELPWTSTTYDQFFSRAWRKGQTETVWVTAMLGKDTLDVAHFDKLGRRRTKVNQATIGEHVDVSGDIVAGFLQKGFDVLGITA